MSAIFIKRSGFFNVLFLILLSNHANSSQTSSWVPISNSNITTIIPVPAVYVQGVGVYNTGDEQRIIIGDVGATSAYYYRAIDSITGQAGAWQCSTASDVINNGNILVAQSPNVEGNYKYEVSACMTGSQCDVSQFEQGKLACSAYATSNETQVVDVSGERAVSPSDSVTEHVGAIAAEFRVSESGAATYSIPIALPKSTAGVQPQVALTYSSQAGSGIMGQGWNISASSSISRCGKTPVYDGKQGGVSLTQSDRLCFNGQRLLKNRIANSKNNNDIGITDAAYWSTDAKYHTAIDSFATITPHYNSGGSLRAFTVENKAGEIHYYGDLTVIPSNANSLLGKKLSRGFYLQNGIYSTGKSDAYLHKDGDLNKGFTWLIKGVEDVKGNYFVYNYTSSLEGYRSFYDNYASHNGQSYLMSIEYTGNSRQSNKKPYAKVLFNYKESRKRRSGWFVGSPTTQAALLENIVVSINGQEFRKYTPTYYESDFLDEKNYLESLEECQGSVCNAPLTFNWQKPDPIETSLQDSCHFEDTIPRTKVCHKVPTNDPFKPFESSSTFNFNAANNSKALFFDFNGDGYSDIVYPDGSWKVKYGPTFTTSKTLSGTSGYTGKAEFARILDVDGNGILDFIVAKDKDSDWVGITNKKTIVSSQSCEYGPKYDPSNCEPTTIEVHVSSIGKKAIGLEGSTQIMDVDGDSLQDIVYSTGLNFYYYKNLGSRAFSSAKLLTTIPIRKRIPLPDDKVNREHEIFNGDYRYSNTAGAANATVLDFNGDGITDLLVGRKTTVKDCSSGQLNSTEISTSSFTSSSSTCKTSYETDWYIYSGSDWESPAQEISGNAFNKPKAVDLNGDGLTDIIWRSGNHLNYRLSNGTELLGVQTVMIAGGADNTILPFTDEQENYSYFLDASGDGRTDLLIANNNQTARTTYFARPLETNNEQLIFEARGTWNFDKSKITQFSDINGDGQLDLLEGSNSKWNVFYSKNANKLMHVISSVENGHGVTNSIIYSSITNTFSNFQNELVATYIQKESTQGLNADGTRNKDYFSPKTGMFMVSRVDSLSNYGTTSSVAYQYGGLLLHKKGYGNLGFELLRTIDLQTCGESTTRVPFQLKEDDEGAPIYAYRPITYTNYDDCIITTTTYNQLAPYTGIPKSTVQSLGVGDNAILISDANNNVESKGTYFGGVQTYIKKSTERRYALNTDLTSSSLISRTETSNTYDYFGNATNITTFTDNLLTGSKSSTNNQTVTTANVFGSSNLDKLMGRLSRATVTKSLTIGGSKAPVNGSPGNLVKTASFTYNSDKMLETETTSLGTTTHGYDSWGNRTSSTFVAINDNGAQSNTRSTSKVYDNRGRYVISTTDANNVSTESRYKVAGSESYVASPLGIIEAIQTIDANGAKSQQFISAFGVLSETKVSASPQSPTLITKMYTRKCSSVSCGFAGAFYRQISIASGGLESQVFFDAWGREIASKKRLLDGSWQVVVKDYDELGRLKSVTEPNKNAASNYKTDYHYDRLGRVGSETTPTGHTISRIYNGNQVTTIDQKGNKQRVTTNFVGQNSSVEQLSAANTLLTKLTYTYNVESQLVTAKVYTGSTLSHTQVTNIYNTSGQKTQMTDLDKGTWSYQFNSFGELYQQTNSSSQVTTFSFDKMGRQVARLDPDGLTCWEYDTKVIGALSRVAYKKGSAQSLNTCLMSWVDSPNYEESYEYGHNLKVSSTRTVIDGENFFTETMYDSLNRPKYTLYPANGFTVEHKYNGYGAATALKNVTTGHRDYGKIYQEIKAVDARGNVTDVRYANGVKQTRGFKSSNGYIEAMSLTKGTTLLDNQAFKFDAVGNLEERSHNYGLGGTTHDFCERFSNDSLYRLDTARTTTGTTTCSNSGGIFKNYDYDRLGNITYKQGVGYYTYDSAKKNRLAKITTGPNGSGSTVYDFSTSNSYDNRGNVLKDASRTFTYASYDKPTLITKGGINSHLEYDANRNLYLRKDVRSDGVTESLYVKGLYERIKGSNGITEHKYYVGNVVVTDRSNGTYDTFYLHKDHLGSTTTITNASGSVVQHINYDAWGKQNRFHTSGSLISLLEQQSPAESKGYTGHKELSGLDIIHMNGRIYDPTLGRFVQADPFIQFPNNSQSYNRYSYVLNNPMSFTDPTGYFSFSGFLKQSYKRTMMIDGRYTAHKFTGRNPALHSIGVTALNFIPYFGPLAAAHANFDHALVNTGSLRAAFTSGATSLAISGVFYGIGQAFDASSGFWQTGGAAHIGAHALAGGVISDLQGGNFGHGFWSAGITKAANVNGLVGTQQGVEWDALRIAVAATIGGTVSKLTGGKFANGATTAAFAQAFNANKQASRDEEINEIKSKLNIDNEQVRKILQSFYPQQKGVLSEVKITPEMRSLATDMLANAMYSSVTMNYISRLFAVVGTGGFGVPSGYFDHAVDLANGGATEWSFFINGHDYSNPYIYNSVRVSLARNFRSEFGLILSGAKN